MKMIKVNEVLRALEILAPPERKMDFDNVGLLVGWGDRPACRILTALDITDEVISEAAELSVDLIVTHHPVIFNALKTVTDNDVTGSHLIRLIENGISVISMHTNLDAADHGVNDALARRIGLKDITLLTVDGTDSDGVEYCCGRVGTTEAPMSIREYLPFLRRSLNVDGLRYCDAGVPVSRVAVVGGSGGGYLSAAVKAGCDTLITADVKYDVFLAARESAINIIDADHFCTENTVIPVVTEYLEKQFPQLSVITSERHRQIVRTWK